MLRRLSSQSGQDTIEWAGALVVVALIVAALIAVGIPTSVADAVECNVKKVLTGGGGSCAQRPGQQPSGTKGAGPGAAAAAPSKPPGPGSIPPGYKPQLGFGHCGPDFLPAQTESYTSDFLPGGVYVGDICNWHDHCTAWTSYLNDGYNCDMLFRQALHARCNQAPQPQRAVCNVGAEGYFFAVEKARNLTASPGSMPNHSPPPPQVGYPPGVHH